MTKLYNIKKVSIEQNSLVLVINGREYRFSLLSVSKKLASAGEKERKYFKISPSGYGIHWPLLDEDISINGLLNKR